MAGSKIKVTSIIHMAWELAALLLAYQVSPTQGAAVSHCRCNNQATGYCCDPVPKIPEGHSVLGMRW